jgi:hypothetical protein
MTHLDFKQEVLLTHQKKAINPNQILKSRWNVDFHRLHFPHTQRVEICTFCFLR